MSQVLRILEVLEVERCPECYCAIGDDWQFIDFSNHDLVECPQCGEPIEVSNV